MITISRRRKQSPCGIRVQCPYGHLYIYGGIPGSDLWRPALGPVDSSQNVTYRMGSYTKAERGNDVQMAYVDQSEDRLTYRYIYGRTLTLTLYMVPWSE
jgi:hypothetical protein